MEMGKLKVIATICLVFLMIVGHSNAASKCYEDCYHTCLVRIHDDPLRCQRDCIVKCGETSSDTLTDSCEENCASKYCGNQKLGIFLAHSLTSVYYVFP